jgi:hypothetical protein
MYANFTEETCTGTGDTLTLAGATTDNLAFSLSYADGDLVAYAVEDSGGSIKITGIGTYNSGANTITRNDTYNYNGTVVDKKPSTNITLSGGTHTVRSDAVTDTLLGISGYHKQSTANGENKILNGLLNSGGGANPVVPSAANQQQAYAFRFMESANVENLYITVLTADASASASWGLSKLSKDGLSDTSYIISGVLDVSTTGLKSIAVSRIITAGYYLIHYVNDGTTAALNCTTNNMASGTGSWSPLTKTVNTNREQASLALEKSGVTGGVLDANPETVVSPPSANDFIPLFYFSRA